MISDLKHFASQNIPLETRKVVNRIFFLRNTQVAKKLIDSPVYRIADQYKRRKGSIPVKKTQHKLEANRGEAENEYSCGSGGDSRVGAHFLERLSHNALPKNRKRETLDACTRWRQN